MKFAIRLMIFSILLNLSVGLMQTAIPAFKNIDAYRGGMKYDTTGLNDFTNEMNNTVSPTGDLEDAEGWFDRLLDKLNLGIIKRFLRVINSYMWGFVNIMQTVLNINASLIFFIKTLISISYVLGSLWLWSGKDIGKG